MIKKPHLRTLLLIFAAAILGASLACNLPAGVSDLETSIDREGTEDLQSALNAEVIDDRAGVLEYLGVPDAFDIAIVEVEGVDVRMESWRYYQFGTQVDFVDGEAVWTIEIEPMPAGTIFAAWYDPLAFEEGMTVSEASQVAASASPAGTIPQLLDLSDGGDDFADGLALVGDQIMIGFSGNRVVYVETVAMEPIDGE